MIKRMRYLRKYSTSTSTVLLLSTHIVFVVVCIGSFRGLTCKYRFQSHKMCLPLPRRLIPPPVAVARKFHSTTQVFMRGRPSKVPKADDEDIVQHLEPDWGLDVPVAGYLMYRQQRQTLNYMRLMEHEVPKLVG